MPSAGYHASANSEPGLPGSPGDRARPGWSNAGHRQITAPTAALNTDDITALDAQRLSAAIRARTLSCREVMQAYLARIHRLNPRLNAIVNLARDEDLL
jgi:hypothetical protein